ncbi:hypothetical protein MKEN_01326600 [Mycena kentingensis (nom. inval.)]|nr:hypothetical protein MKEN_01326600 [Mycena kentingensis (nom. inval.)]
MQYLLPLRTSNRSVPTPPAPQPNLDLRLPSMNAIHPALGECAPELDLSLPSAHCANAIRSTVGSWRNAPATNPARRAIVLRIASPKESWKTTVEVTGTGNGGVVTVADVFYAINRTLRAVDGDAAVPREARSYAACRARTSPDPAHESGARMVDRLLGHTLFAGLTPMQKHGKDKEGNFHVELSIPTRYQ